jgi:hypothetical protein
MAIAGGVLLSTIISFFLVPPMFVVVNRLGRKRLPTTPAQPASQARYPAAGVNQA